MKRTHLQIVLLTLLAIGLFACGPKAVDPAVPAQVIDGKPKADTKKANPPDDAPKAVDPLKDGY